MQKIIHVIHRDDIGGGENLLAQHLRYYGDRYQTWVIHGNSGVVTKACSELGITNIKIPIDTKLKCLVGFFYLLWWLWKIRPDLLILHGQWAGPLGAIAGKLIRVPHMIYLAEWPSFYTDWDIFRTIRNFIAEWFPLNLTDRTITVSYANRYQYLIRSSLMEDKITSLSNMIELEKMPKEEDSFRFRRELHWEDDTTHVVSVGRLASQKRVDWLLKSWKIVQDSGVKARLWIVGGGDLEKELKALARELGIEKNCVFLGPNPQGVKFSAAGDIVAMTTMYEANSLVPMEAMACGKPVVASSADGVRDTFADGREGFLVSPGNIQLFAERLLTLIRDPALRKRMGAAGRIRAEYYDSTKVLERYLMVIDLELSKKK